MSNKTLREKLRILHILATIPLGAFIYAPHLINSTFTLIMGLVVFPILAITGLWMWQGHLIRRLVPKNN
jgi:hypothetical protein